MTILSVILGVVGSLWIFVKLADQRTDQETALHLAKRLQPFAGTYANAKHMSEDELWAFMDGLRGAWGMLGAAGSIASLASQIARLHPEAADAAQMIFWRAFALRGYMWKVLLESMVCRFVPIYPRTAAGAMVRLYCEIAALFIAVQSIASPA